MERFLDAYNVYAWEGLSVSTVIPLYELENMYIHDEKHNLWEWSDMTLLDVINEKTFLNYVKKEIAKEPVYVVFRTKTDATQRLKKILLDQLDELDKTNNEYVEQIIRPTGLLDPIVEVRPTKHQIDDLVDEIHERIKKNERVLITALTVRMAEELTNYLKQFFERILIMGTKIITKIDKYFYLSISKLVY